MRVVLDTNIVFSAIASPAGPPGQVVARWFAREFTWVSSGELLSELERVLRSKKARRHPRVDADTVEALLKEFREAVQVVTPSLRLTVLTDDADNRVLEAAIEGAADYIVTGDRALLELAEYEGVRIVSPREFLALMQVSG